MLTKGRSARRNGFLVTKKLSIDGCMKAKPTIVTAARRLWTGSGRSKGKEGRKLDMMAAAVTALHLEKVLPRSYDSKIHLMAM